MLGHKMGIRAFSFSLIGSLVCAGAQTALQSHDPSYKQIVDQLRGSYRSELLQDAVEGSAHWLLNGTREQKRAAIDFFWDLRAKNLLSKLLADQDFPFDFELAQHLASSLADLAVQSDVQLAQVAIAQLELTEFPTSGGGEVQIPRKMYRYQLGVILERVTGRSLMPAELRPLPATAPHPDLFADPASLQAPRRGELPDETAEELIARARQLLQHRRE